MKKKKWILPVCVVAGMIVLLFTALLITAAVFSAMGYGISTGMLYFSEDRVFLIDGNTAIIVSDQSKESDLFSGYFSGDQVILVHDGVEETLPARTGGYLVFRLSKGDGTYKPSNEVLGIENLSSGCDTPVGLPLNYDVQYIRTNGYHEDVEYLVVKIIRSVEELNEYYLATKDKYDLERKEKVYSDTTIGFLDAIDKYDERYFENQILVIILLEEGRGSIRHNVQSITKGTDGNYYINIDTIAPEIGTADMAQWHLLIEPEKGTVIETESSVVVLIDGINPLTQPERVQHARGYANIFLDIPDGWEYATEDADGSNDFCIAFWPAGKEEGKIRVWYYDFFGVCGTGLVEEKISIAGYEAYKGTYDNRKVWSFIGLIGTPGKYVIMNDGADAWWDEYGEEAMQILSTLKVADGIIDEAAAIEIAKKQATVAYNQVYASYDMESGIWTVMLSKRNTAGGNQDISITHEGKVIDVQYGE